ncbi:serine/threonine protein kinase [Defluviimonas sp. WL0024]|uniref:Serine/threonine protein kinase n=1 Tax=Albidovulum salinarum TaxID=2984153 RepID=A0ABT2X1T3_9RHOB|nr:serine/threonine-protein kinase [Defluviimonas sp. WL0024]MCU9847898.1 serine/threonine protein kinase [Defluviimonas sp. WL0024]
MQAQLEAETPVDQEDFVDELSAGTKLLNGQYTISRFLNHGGFGITYLAKDSLDRDVVIKECFPGAFCRRSNTIVGARSRAHQAEFRSIVRLFVQEARNLSKLAHPNIVGVHQVFEDNDTAYMAIDYVNGRDLLAIIEDPEVEFAPTRIVSITRRLLDAVAFVHASGLLHRDIAPDNILINGAGEPILIDFGAAREEATRASRALSALRVVKDGYSPQEFYIAGSEQGPWSDLYALGASIYHAIAGEAPANSQVRLAAIAESKPDPYVPLAGRFPGYPEGFLGSVDHAMNVLPRNRIQSAGDWLSLLDGAAVASASAAAAAIEAAVAGMVAEAGQQDVADPQDEPQEKKEQASAPQDGAGRKEASAPPATGKTEVAALRPTGRMEAVAPSPTERKSRRGLMLGAAAIAIVAAVGVAMTMTGPEPAAKTVPAAPGVAETPASETKTATEAKVAEPVAVTTATTESAATESPVIETAATEGAAAESAAAPVRAELSYAVWDVSLPFASEYRVIGTTRFARLTGVNEGVDPALVGDWMVDGAMIFAINGRPISITNDLAAQVLRDITVGKDGMAHAELRIKTPGGAKYQSVEIAIPAVRRVGLADATSLESRLVDGAWKTVAVGVTEGATSKLHDGDVLLREVSTNTRFDAADSAERLIEKLAGGETTEATLEVQRGGQTTTVTMSLAPAS